MKKSYLAIIIIIICTIFTSLGQLFLKFGANKLELAFVPIITNIPLIIGCALYGIGAIIMVFALKHGDLSLIYPFLSLSFIWVALLSLIFLGEHLVFMQWLGIIIIILGVIFVARGAKSA
ncbi:MAG: EamA family transporter [Nanoarchaeota archaeon]|nr:EamA family transporter [Nanoarchaeota archaeon]MBU1321092.1 EamA family transporter [Nanoarchaeota archaeon]MBU1596955.1 EamA family transporter [Nanoarchaeota archaeon]MBU2441254.1 EamA family transporter [Nanoarchaeota archaeon]